MKLLKPCISALFCACFAAPAFGTALEPGSLLIYPYFNSEDAVATIITVTNTNPDAVSGKIDVHFIYIDGETCQESNRTETLTANDTFSVIANWHNPDQAFGYLYVYAVKEGVPVTFNHLIGQLATFDGIETLEYGMNACPFNGQTDEGTSTDVDGDGHRDFDGVEYEQVQDQFFFPRFFGQSDAFESEAIFLNMSGGTQFLTTIDILSYNDNELAFSSEYTFNCWTRVYLADISGAFLETFLDSTANDEDELGGMSSIETGWVRLDGGVASSSVKTINDPAFIAVLVERVASFASADLSFGQGHQDNGTLLPRSVNGDNAD